MSQQHIPEWQIWAQFRLSVIGELLYSPPPRGELQQAIARLAQKVYRHPIDPDRQLSIGASTIERWYYKARKAQDPVAVLGRRIRSDSGVRWSMSEILLKELKAQYDQYPRWTVQLHYDNLKVRVQNQPHLGKLPSYKTVLRCMRDNGWIRSREPAQATNGQLLAAKRKEQREIRGFEVPYHNGLWHLDFHHAKVRILDGSGRWHQPMALAILDDYTRICCHLQFYLSETAECLIHGLNQAFMKRGLPRALMSDNGAAMIAEEARQGLGRLGVDHKTTLPYSPYQNGKQEIFWSQLEGRFLELLRHRKDLKLSFLNQAGQAWVEQDYHRRHHREIKSTPLERMLSARNVARTAPDGEALRLAFTRRFVRKVRRGDLTVMVGGIRYELPTRFSHLSSAALRAPGWDKSHMVLVDEKTDVPLARLIPQDKVRNASGQRRLISPKPATVSSCSSGETPIPELLGKWMKDYAATGLPPAYLTKEETTIE